MQSYVGITGFMTREEVDAIIKLFLPQSPPRKLMIGVLASSGTLRGERGRNPQRYPRVETLVSMFTNHQHVVNLIHYETDEPDTLTEQLVRATELGGPNLHGLQLNHMPWPDVNKLKSYRSQCKPSRLVLQIGRTALEMIDNSSSQLVSRIEGYMGIITDVLIDPSGGMGQAFDVNETRRYLGALRSEYPYLGLVVAGGLSPETLGLVEPFLDDFSDLGIDVEGRVRTHEDTLDIQVAGLYLQLSMEMFAMHQTYQ
ncbi:hypothetical protein IID24_01335 [Patescibacteria group bacterium]|nr:hypothetical protein [Patescibacteria group bacterium]